MPGECNEVGTDRASIQPPPCVYLIRTITAAQSEIRVAGWDKAVEFESRCR